MQPQKGSRTGTIGVTGDYAQRRKHVHSVSSLDVGLIRERCTSEHGERASERQHQCENLFEVAYKRIKSNDIQNAFSKTIRKSNYFVNIGMVEIE